MILMAAVHAAAWKIVALIVEISRVCFIDIYLADY